MMPHGSKLTYLPDFKGSTALNRRLIPEALEIRVLTVWPNENFSSPLECTLAIGTYRDTPKGRFYDALSYYWGSTNDLERVIIHGSDEGRPTPSCELPVTKNLTAAMRYLRKKATAAGQPLQLWIDALCINQRDAQERSGQVSIMSRIFQLSRRVIVWLSDRNCNTLAAKGLKYMADVCDRFSDLDSDSSRQREQVADYIADQDLDVSDMIDAIEALTNLPYWRRGWISQEVSSSDIPKLLVLEEETFTLVRFGTFGDALNATCNHVLAQGSHPSRLVPLAKVISTICFQS